MGDNDFDEAFDAEFGENDNLVNEGGAEPHDNTEGDDADFRAAEESEGSRLSVEERRMRIVQRRREKAEQLHHYLNRKRKKIKYPEFTWKLSSGQVGRCDLEERTMTIGSGDHADIIIADSEMDEVHAKLRRLGTGFFEIVAMAQEGRVRVREGMLNKMVLLPGDRFILGGTIFGLRGVNTQSDPDNHADQTALG